MQEAIEDKKGSLEQAVFTLIGGFDGKVEKDLTRLAKKGTDDVLLRYLSDASVLVEEGS